MTKEEAMKQFAYLGAVWFGNSKQHFAFSAYDRLNGWNKLAELKKGALLCRLCVASGNPPDNK